MVDPLPIVVALRESFLISATTAKPRARIRDQRPGAWVSVKHPLVSECIIRAVPVEPGVPYTYELLVGEDILRGENLEDMERFAETVVHLN